MNSPFTHLSRAVAVAAILALGLPAFAAETAPVTTKAPVTAPVAGKTAPVGNKTMHKKHVAKTHKDLVKTSAVKSTDQTKQSAQLPVAKKTDATVTPAPVKIPASK
jgi:hypothetical protein